jgi:hypothetical protein
MEAFSVTWACFKTRAAIPLFLASFFASGLAVTAGAFSAFFAGLEGAFFGVASSFLKIFPIAMIIF